MARFGKSLVLAILLAIALPGCKDARPTGPSVFDEGGEEGFQDVSGGSPRKTKTPPPETPGGDETPPGSGEGTQPLAAGAIEGTVLDEAGAPAGGVTVTAYLTSVGNSGLTWSNSGLTSTGNSGFRIQADAPRNVTGEARTAADGRFRLVPTATGSFSLEAVKSETRKARKPRLLFDNDAVSAGELRLAPTGTLFGRVTAPSAPTVSDFTGVVVFIPGSPYEFRTDRDGKFTFRNVASGSYSVLAERLGLGSARRDDQVVVPDGATEVPDLEMAVKSPKIASVTPRNAPPGTKVRIAGESFGASSGRLLEVTFNGSKAVTSKILDDRTIEAEVPPGATTGNLVVTVEGILSNGFAFPVIKSLALAPETLSLLLGSSATFDVRVLDTAGVPVPEPFAALAPAGDAIRIKAPPPAVEAVATGDALVLLGSGSLPAATLSVHVFAIVGLSVSPVSLALFVPPADGSSADPGVDVSGKLTATLRTSDGLPRGIAWSSSDKALADVDAAGLVSVPRTSPGGNVVITARSVDDARVAATASVSVKREGWLELILE